MPPPPTSPNDPMIRSGVLQVPLGPVSVSGDFHHILTHFYDWQYFNRLVLVDGLSLSGNSPYMQGSYTATLYIFPQNDDNLAAPVKKAGGVGTGAGGSGFPGAGSAPGPGSYPGASGPPPGAGSYPGAGGYPGGH